MHVLLGIIVLMSMVVGYAPVYGATLCECDLNRDRRCDMRDWLLFGKSWGRTDCPVD
jgi:hypothetical protein